MFTKNDKKHLPPQAALMLLIRTSGAAAQLVFSFECGSYARRIGITT